jgi:hypothetical protein
MFYAFHILLIPLVIVAQYFLPMLPSGGRIYLLPMVLFHGALMFNLPRALVLVALGGGIWDLLHAHWNGVGFEIGVGWSVGVFGLIGVILNGFQALFARGRWEVHCLASGIGTSVAVLLEFVLLSVRREPIHFEFGGVIWARVIGPGLLALVLAPLVSMALRYLGRLMGHSNLREFERDP